MDEVINAAAATDLVVTSSTKKIKRLFGSTSSTDMFFKGGQAPIGIDVEKDPWFTEFLKGGFTSISHGNGGFSRDYGIVEDRLHIGGEGNGWNAIPPVDCTIKQGELCADYRVGGKNLDFWNSHMILRNKMGAENYIIANMLKGTLEQLYRQIDATLPQKAIFIQFNEETGPEQWGNGANYANECYEWQAAIEKHYPQQRFRYVFDVPNLWNAENGISEKAARWAEEIVSVKPVDKKKWSIRQYCHGWDMWALTGNLENDIAQIDNAINKVLPEFTRIISESVFAGCKVFLGQVSAHEYDKAGIIRGANYIVSAYARFTKHFIDSLIDGPVQYIGQCYIGMNSWINKQLAPNLDFQWVSVMNNLYVQGLKACKFSGIDTEVDIYGGYKDRTLRIVMQNRSGREVALPKTFTFDGVQMDFVPVKVIGRACAAVNSTNSTDHDPTAKGFLSGYGIYYFEILGQ